MKYIIPGLLLILLVAGCVTQDESVSSQSNFSQDMTFDEANVSISEPEKIEVYHFHATRQCYSCITVGDYADETVKTYFAEELKSGKIVFAHINGDLPENAELVEKYGAAGSSLWIGVYDENGFHAEQNTNVWYKIKDKEEYMTYLKGVLENKLKGVA
ncbi:nitrophenyl compound nitroreductase subunit ArsF family protein [Candidatus Undinarchaeota archaeon]